MQQEDTTSASSDHEKHPQQLDDQNSTKSNRPTSRLSDVKRSTDHHHREHRRRSLRTVSTQTPLRFLAERQDPRLAVVVNQHEHSTHITQPAQQNVDDVVPKRSQRPQRLSVTSSPAVLLQAAVLGSMVNPRMRQVPRSGCSGCSRKVVPAYLTESAAKLHAQRHSTQNNTH